MSVNDGGPAFPRPPVHIGHEPANQWWFMQDGMSLRDYYAGVALPNCMEETGTWSHGIIESRGHGSWQEAAAAMAYDVADAMLAAQHRGETP